MIRLNPEKLHLSKWTAVQPVDREKHFIVVELVRDDRDLVTGCWLEAVYSRRRHQLAWQELMDGSRWTQGWR